MRVVLVASLVLALASATSAAAVGRIVGGQETSISQYPFMASILHSYDYSFFMPACAGAIISSRSILTAMSCWTTFGRFRVRVGSSNAFSGGTVLETSTLTFPASYNPVTLENDIAIVKTVVNGITFVPDAVMPVGFASATSVVPDDTFVTIAGWGRTEVVHYSEQLRHVEVRTLNNRDCDSLSSPDVYVPSNMFCTTSSGFPAPDVCIGDNGSPVILNNIIVGLVAHPRCGSQLPSVHTRTSAHTSFIQSNLN